MLAIATMETDVAIGQLSGGFPPALAHPVRPRRAKARQGNAGVWSWGSREPNLLGIKFPTPPSPV